MVLVVAQLSTTTRQVCMCGGFRPWLGGGVGAWNELKRWQLRE